MRRFKSTKSYTWGAIVLNEAPFHASTRGVNLSFMSHQFNINQLLINIDLATKKIVKKDGHPKKLWISTYFQHCQNFGFTMKNDGCPSNLPKNQTSPRDLDLHLDLLPFLVIFDSQPLDARGFQAEIYALLAEDGRPSKAPDTAESAYDEAGEASPEPPMPPAPWRKTNGGWIFTYIYTHIHV